MTVHIASGALIITLTWLVIHSQALMLRHHRNEMGINSLNSDYKLDQASTTATRHSFPDYDNYEKRASTRNSDPNHDLAASTAMDTSVLLNLPVGNPPGMTRDIPGPPITPEEYNFKIPDTVQDYVVSDTKDDPIELAGAFEGDILLSTQAELQQMTQPGHETMAANTRNAVIELDKVWPNAEIPYVISSTYGPTERGTIAVAVRSFHDNTCIKFVPRTTQQDYIHIYQDNGCFSSVGRVGGSQAVSLGTGCLYPGIVMHELMHAAGFWHEQSRFDRDQYIKIYWKNIKSGMENNFQKYNWSTISHLNKQYDLGSIMHYGEKSFAKDSKRPTIESLNGDKIGQRTGFSTLDLEKLNKLYKCGEKSEIKVTTSAITSGGNQKECVDFDNSCSGWAKIGECDRNPDFMLASCKKSCNTCDKGCIDLDKSCAYWAKINECTTNTAYMHLYCKSSCGLCHHANDVTNDCIDQNKYCVAWAAEGTCHTNPDYMVTFCKMSCTTCEPM